MQANQHTPTRWSVGKLPETAKMSSQAAFLWISHELRQNRSKHSFSKRRSRGSNEGMPHKHLWRLHNFLSELRTNGMRSCRPHRRVCMRPQIIRHLRRQQAIHSIRLSLLQGSKITRTRRSYQFRHPPRWRCRRSLRLRAMAEDKHLRWQVKRRDQASFSRVPSSSLEQLYQETDCTRAKIDLDPNMLPSKRIRLQISSLHHNSTWIRKPKSMSKSPDSQTLPPTIRTDHKILTRIYMPIHKPIHLLNPNRIQAESNLWLNTTLRWQRAWTRSPSRFSAIVPSPRKPWTNPTRRPTLYKRPAKTRSLAASSS